MMRILRMNLAGLALLGPALFWALHAQSFIDAIVGKRLTYARLIAPVEVSA